MKDIVEACDISRGGLYLYFESTSQIFMESAVEIVPYSPEYQKVFQSLNEYWITRYWELEPHDKEQLCEPQTHIIDKGGFILVALHNGNPVGVCAMCRMEGDVYDYELAKLTVNPANRGMGIGKMLCDAAIEKARAKGAKKLFLESNTILRTAISMYRKLGFRELKEYHPAYMRGDIQMELSLD